MSGPKIITWLPIDPTLIAPSQSLAAAGSLVVNSRVPNQPMGEFIYDKVIRQVRFTSTGNIAAVNFTITGIGTPVDPVTKNPTGVVSLVSEVVNGVTNVAPQNSANIYQRIISITADAAVPNVSVGSGPEGITDFVFLNTKSMYGGASCTIQFENFVNISATGYVSLNKPQIPDINSGNLIDSPFMAFKFINSTQADAFNPIQPPCSVVWLNIVDTTTDSINFTVLQQGVYP